MLKIIVDKNENEQRIDRFLKKFLDKANTNFINKMLRKKNIKLNGKKAEPQQMIYTGDVIELFLSDETIAKFKTEKEHVKSGGKLDIVYEDINILIMNKPRGVLSHSVKGEFEFNVVDNMISYLIEKGDYVPRIEKTFTPAICNRLDRNTSGLLIGAKNYDALKSVNEAIRDLKIEKYYQTIVRGEFLQTVEKKAFLRKDSERNLAEVFDSEVSNSKEIFTRFRPLEVLNGYTFLEVEIITGRTHQIRSQLSTMGYSIIGDEKYGDRQTNKTLREKYGLRGQFLHCAKLVFNGFEGELEYLNGKEFTAPLGRKQQLIKEKLFGGEYDKDD